MSELKCDYPYYKTRKLVCWSGTLLSGMCMKEHDKCEFKEVDLPEYYDALVEDGINSERNFAVFLDDDEYWKAYRPWVGDDLDVVNEEYYQVFNRRMALVAERKLTEIVTVGPYAGYHLKSSSNFPGYVHTFICRTQKWMPYIIYETWNEPTGSVDEQYDSQKLIVDILKAVSIPLNHIQVNWFDSSLFFKLISEDLQGKGLAAIHWYGSERSADTLKVGMMASHLIPNGTYPCSDGQDWHREAKGLDWPWDITKEYRRPSVGQIRYISKVIFELGGRGFDHLSASGFQPDLMTPNLKKAIELGRDERRAMGEVFGTIPKPPEPPPEPIYVKVFVCKDSGLLPNKYCPVKVLEEFEFGDEPRETCEVHQVPKPKPCSYWFKKLDFRRWWKCIWGK